MELSMASQESKVTMLKRKLDHDEHEHGTPSKYYESYVRLVDDRVIFLNEAFTKDTSSTLSAWLLHYDHEDSEKEITIYINSPGGDASALSNIYDVIQLISAPVKTVCLGKCYSAGAVLLAAGTKGKRYILPHAEVMIHGIQCAFPVISSSSHHDAKSYLTFLNNINDNIMKILAKHTGHTLEKVKQDCLNDVWLDAKQAIAYGLVDHILGE